MIEGFTSAAEPGRPSWGRFLPAELGDWDAVGGGAGSALHGCGGARGGGCTELEEP